MGTPEERFWKSVQKTSYCWLYQGKDGYGKLLVEGKYVRAHRFSWKLHFGPIPDGLLVCHRCDNKICIRPDHLFLGTHADNAADKVSKGRQARSGATNPQRGENHYNAKLTEEDVRQIRTFYALGNTSQTALGKQFGVGPTMIYKIVHGKKWRHVI
jgi:hypothetical protein